MNINHLPPFIPLSQFVFAPLGMVLISALAAGSPPTPEWLPEAPPLPPPEGQVIEVETVEEFFEAVEDVEPGGTILLADGHYAMPRYIEIRTDDVTLRSASGDRDAVVLDGAESRHGELLGVTDCSGVTVAEITLRNVTYNALKLNTNHDVQDVTVHNCVFHNVWQRGVKSVRAPETPSHNGEIRYCLFYNDRSKEFGDDPTDTEDTFGGNYVGAIDLMDAVGWRIHHNAFVGIEGRTGEGRGAIFIWQDSRDCVIEHNVIVDCDGGISLGNAHKPDDVEWHCEGFVARDNWITRAPMGAITAVYTRDSVIERNRIYDPENQWRRSIRVVFDNPGLTIVENIIAGYPIGVEGQDEVTLERNAADAGADWFRNPETGDLSLTEEGREAVGE